VAASYAGAPGSSHLTSSDAGLTGADQGDLPPPKPMSAAKARDMTTVNVLAGEEAPGVAHPVPVQVDVQADAKAVASMTVPELRTALRSRGLSPAGSRATLVERLLAGLATGAAPVVVASKEYNAGLDSTQLGLAYARSEGAPLPEGVGRDRPGAAMAHAMHDSSHIARALSGGDPSGDGTEDGEEGLVSPGRRVNEAALAQMASHWSLAGEGPGEGDGAAAAPKAPHPRRAADAAGHDVFTPEEQVTKEWLPLKMKDYQGSGIFQGDEAPAARTSSHGAATLPAQAKLDEMTSHMAADGTSLTPSGDLPPPHALSDARSAELHGEGVFAVADSPLPAPSPASAGMTANLASSVFDGSPGGSKQPSPGSADVLSGRTRQYTSKCFSEEFTGPVPLKPLDAAKAKHVGDLYSTEGGVGCTMAYQQGDPNPPAPVARASARKSSGGGASSIVFG
jgi:hypothetical protein